MPRDELLHRLLTSVSRGEVRYRDEGMWITGRPAQLDETLGVSAILAKTWAFMSPATAGQSCCLLNLDGFIVLSTWDREVHRLSVNGLTSEEERSLLHLLFEVHLDGNELSA